MPFASVFHDKPTKYALAQFELEGEGHQMIHLMAFALLAIDVITFGSLNL